MVPLFVHGHALKHSLTEKQIRYAWNNDVVAGIRKRTDGMLFYVSIGFDESGRAIEMVAVMREEGYLIIHANTPPTKRTLYELGIEGGSRER